jgi:hypothetical protein
LAYFLAGIISLPLQLIFLNEGDYLKTLNKRINGGEKFSSAGKKTNHRLLAASQLTAFIRDLSIPRTKSSAAEAAIKNKSMIVTRGRKVFFSRPLVNGSVNVFDGQ